MSGGNKESVEPHAIELRHKLAQHLGQRVKYPTSSVEHIWYKAPPPAKDLNSDRLVCPEETLTQAERTSNTREIEVTAGMAAEIGNIAKKTKVTMATGVEDSSGESEAEPTDVEDDAVYAKRYDDDMEISGSDKIESGKMANDDWDQLGETSKGKSNREKFVRDTTKTYEKAKRPDYT